MLNAKRFLYASGITQLGEGGQELILYEILALLEPTDLLWLPFPEQCATLALTMTNDWRPRHDFCSLLYFGTPTIVEGRALFKPLTGAAAQIEWTKQAEREVVQSLCYVAEHARFRLIVSGLGSGDISVDERLEDMGGGEVVAMKKFDDFTDWVLARQLR